MNTSKGIISSAALIAGLFQPADAIQIEFDYSYDTHGFFTNQLTGSPIQNRRARLEQAASFYTGFTDHLSPIKPSASNHWSVNIAHPSQLGSSISLTNLTVAENTLRIFVGGSSSSPAVLGFAGTGWGLSATGSQMFEDSVHSRGQLNTIGEDASDYGLWGGTIWFNDVHSWYFGEDESDLSTDSPDFLTTATHELGHILGYGEADSWSAAINADSFFTGSSAIAAYGELIPISQFGAHWGEDVLSDRNGILQEAMMDPSTPFGQRQLPTTLDYAGFEDIGWQVTAVPLPSSLLFFLSGLLSFIGGSAHRRARISL